MIPRLPYGQQEADVTEVPTPVAPRETIGSVLVVGAGIAGMQAALDLAEAGFHVYLLERETAIGGHMAQLDKTFPTNDCSMCIVSPKLVETGRHLNIDIITYADLLNVEGWAGHFRATLRHRPRYIDVDKCTGCGECADVCPIILPDPFNALLGERHAAYKLYPQAVPNTYAIDKLGISPCRDACPAGQRAQGYIALIREGRYEDALRVIKEDNPFPGICGRICNHRCEDACNRGKVDEPIAIAALKRFVTDKVYAGPRQPVEALPRTQEERVAVVGAGPAGLTCAQDLVKMGYDVTVFEALPVAGGMLRVGVPEFRLPAAIVNREVQDIVDLGVDLRLNHRVEDLEELFAQGYDAVFLAVGAHEGRKLRIPGSDLEGNMVAIHLLRDVRLGQPPELGKRIVVIGGGNVALDAARTALRLGAEQVQVLCLESREQMPSSAAEIHGAEEEGVQVLPAHTVHEIVGEDGHLSGVRASRIVFRGFLPGGRPDMDVIPASERVLPADRVIFAIGQAVGLSMIPEDGRIGVTRAHTIDADQTTLATAREGVFAAGDAVTGTAYVIEAVAAGHRAAESIHRYLRGDDLIVPPKPELPVVEISEEELAERRAHGEIHGAGRVPMPELPVEQRFCRDESCGEFVEVERGYTDELAQAEAARCLQCGRCSECLSCWYECQADAIIHDDVAWEEVVDVGALILAPGYQISDPAGYEEYGLDRYPNVVTSLQFERLLSASGPTHGHVRRPSDGRDPVRIAWLQCVGSRDQAHPYCSSVCCMYAIKQTIIAKEHSPNLQPHIFMMDVRDFSKGYSEYFYRARDRYGVRFIRSRISSVREDPASRDLLLTYVDDQGKIRTDRFDMVVLSVGMEVPEGVAQLAEATGIELNDYGFAWTEPFSPTSTNRPGIFVCGAFASPKDIPESVVEASAAAAQAMALLSEARWSRTRTKVYPPERDVASEDPRVGVFVCHCGSNIAGVVDVKDAVDYARSLPGVIHAEDLLYTCSEDGLRAIQEALEEHDVNRVVVASCTPLTHEPLFQDTIREVGLNPYYFELANIRNQCSWVHQDAPAAATAKAKDLIRMAVARVCTLEPLHRVEIPVTQRALVVGGGLSGMTAALSLADEGFPVTLVEREERLGGNAWHLHHAVDGHSPRAFLDETIERVRAHELIEVCMPAVVAETSGFVGNFHSRLRLGEDQVYEVEHGVTILATGGREYRGDGGLSETPLLGHDSRVLTQRDLSEALAWQVEGLHDLRTVVMIQCVTPPDQEYYCSRVCCTQAVRNARLLKENDPRTQVYILYRDIRTYGFWEEEYTRARQAGVLFVHFEEDQPPQVELLEGQLRVSLEEPALRQSLEFEPDLLVLSTAILPQEDWFPMAEMFKLGCSDQGFFMEKHVKLNPVDFPGEGYFLCGLAHYPKFAAEAVAQAQAAAARASIILSKPTMLVGGVVAVVEEEKCTACLTCVRVCPFGVPVIDPGRVGAGAIQGAAYINVAACQGCGTCVGECPAKAIQLLHFRDEQIVVKTDALLEAEEVLI
ncbi:MAG: FAD-dependent oxidoreductase [Chloroflexia bacterium]|nr:FAD-dependent oxidoreductase [Chloroflexia bacterium]